MPTVSREAFEAFLRETKDIRQFEAAINKISLFFNNGDINPFQEGVLTEMVVFTQLCLSSLGWNGFTSDDRTSRVISMSTIQPVTNEAELVDYIRDFYEASFFPQGRFNKHRKQIEQWKWNNYRYMLGQVDDILRGLQKENTFYFYDNKDFTMLEFSYSVSPQGYISLQKDFINGQFYCDTTMQCRSNALSE